MVASRRKQPAHPDLSNVREPTDASSSVLTKATGSVVNPQDSPLVLDHRDSPDPHKSKWWLLPPASRASLKYWSLSTSGLTSRARAFHVALGYARHGPGRPRMLPASKNGNALLRPKSHNTLETDLWPPIDHLGNSTSRYQSVGHPLLALSLHTQTEVI